MLSTKLLSRPLIKLVRQFSSNLPLVSTNVDSKTGIATVVMQRAPVNGLNLELLQALSKSFDDLDKDNSKGMVLTSGLPTIFSGGLDIMEMYKPDQKRVREFWTTLQDVWIKLYGCKYPTAAAITGHAPAGGCLLSMSCEYRVMTAGKYGIGLNETALGLMAPSWFQDTMKNVISTRQAEMALTIGRTFSVDEALKIGLIDEIAADQQETIEKCIAFLLKFNKVSRPARNATKQMFRRPTIEALVKIRDLDLKIFLETVNAESTQKDLGNYIASLKKKQK